MFRVHNRCSVSVRLAVCKVTSSKALCFVFIEFEVNIFNIKPVVEFVQLIKSKFTK